MSAILVRDGELAVRIVVLSWRDLQHPEGGGAEVYLDHLVRGLANVGHNVTVLCAAHPNGAADETIDGVRYIRNGGRLSVYPQALRRLRGHDISHADVVVDVQNGIPFLSRLVTHAPVVVLVHHVHKEQWPVVFGRIGAKVGWWVESRLAPRVYRNSRYVAVSGVTRDELSQLGVDPDSVTVIYNGMDEPRPVSTARTAHPSVVVLSRLVPHKRVEQVIDSVLALRAQLPDLHLDVVGDGWWAENLRAYVAERAGHDAVTFHGHVSEDDKARLLARSWVHATASVKEGWGLSVMEAASYGVPSIGYRSAGGLSESILDGVTGLLVDDRPDAFTAALQLLLSDRHARTRVGQQAALRAKQFSWDATVETWDKVLSEASRSHVGNQYSSDH